MELDTSLGPEAAQAAEDDAKKQATGTDGAPVGDVAEAIAEGSLAVVVDGIGSVLSGAADVVGGIFSIFDA